MAVTFAQGTAFAFNMPARQALIAELVGPDDLANALAISNAGLNFNRVAGPAIAGVLLTLPAVGPGGVFALMAGALRGGAAGAVAPPRLRMARGAGGGPEGAAAPARVSGRPGRGPAPASWTSWGPA